MAPRFLPVLALLAACGSDPHGPIADDIFVEHFGDPMPWATAAQLESFERGLGIVTKRYDRHNGLGPGFNVTFCGGCHEKPVMGGAAGAYRTFFIGAQRTEDGAYFNEMNSANNMSGVVRLYYYDKLEELVAEHGGTDHPATEWSDQAERDAWEAPPWCSDEVHSPSARPPVDERINVVGQRNPIPFFGAGLIAEIDEDEILKHADPDDKDGDGISGRPNYEKGLVGRFGVKSQTTSLEGFIRGPLINHLGVTSEPLTQEERALLPIDSSDAEDNASAMNWMGHGVAAFAQAVPPAGPTFDDDCIPDPELTPPELIDLITFTMLLGPPRFEEPTERTKNGQTKFDEANCSACHIPRLKSARGHIPLYSDLLLHDMGPELADGLEFSEATGQEFRSQPLWGIAASGPYLHDGRASTLDQAIRFHGGEAAASRDAYVAMSELDRMDVVEFLLSLGGRQDYTPGRVALDEPIPGVGEYGGPARELTPEEADLFLDARTMFDFEFGKDQGVGGPRFNGDSCRACHFDPVIGGSGPQGVNVIRHGLLGGDGEFVLPAVGSILHRSTSLLNTANKPQDATSIFELRNSPHLFGLGLIEGIAVDTILANADPDDLDEDGISGKPSWVDGGKYGRFGWKGSVPSIDEFVRDGLAMELGMTLPYVEGMTFGRIHDNDGVPDPEFSLEDADLLAFYLKNLAPPPRQPAEDQAQVDLGSTVFGDVGCAHCHIPALEGATGLVPLYSDLLLHEILPPGTLGIEEASAEMTEFRTPPLWGISHTKPYLHDGRADTLDEAIRGHDGEAVPVRDAYGELSETNQAALLAFLMTL